MAIQTDLEQLTGERSELVEKLVAALAERNAELSAQAAQLAARDAELAARDAALAARDAEMSAQAAKHAAQYGSLLEAYRAMELELKLLKRRIFIASAERVDTAQMQLEFEALTQKLNALAGAMGNPSEGDDDGSDDDGPAPDPDPKTRRRSKPTGRRNIEEMGLRKETVTLTDPHMEKLVKDGLARRLSKHEASHKLGRKPAEYFHIEILRTTYATRPDANGLTEMFTADLPPELLPRCLAAPSVLAEVVTDKFSKGLPLYRQEQELLFESVAFDRGTMCRWLDQLGSRFNETIVAAMERDAMESAFCIATDATGFAVQPGKLEGGPRRPCRKGHYFVRIADRDHILFNFTERQRSEDVVALFKGYTGHIQADACSVYNALFRPSDPDAPDDEELPTEAGCWSHCRRKFFEAAFAKLAVGREGLVHLHKIFEAEQRCRAGKPPPSTIKSRRMRYLAPLIDAFMDFAKQHYEREKMRRGPARAALGYAVRQEGPLRAVLTDGRLRIDNNWSERELRKVVRIRDAALFAGSNEHAENAGGHLTLIASAKLHHLNPREYIRDLIRVLPCWPEDRYLELAPLFWTQTRARLDPAELAAEVGWITVPDPIPLRRPGEESPAEDRA